MRSAAKVSSGEATGPELAPVAAASPEPAGISPRLETAPERDYARVQGNLTHHGSATSPSSATIPSERLGSVPECDSASLESTRPTPPRRSPGSLPLPRTSSQSHVPPANERELRCQLCGRVLDQESFP